MTPSSTSKRSKAENGRDLNRRFRQVIRGLQIETRARWPRRRRRSSTFRVFSLDLHASLIQDLISPLEALGVDVEVWSISGHNFVNRRFLTGSDPVRHINARTWRELDGQRCQAFASTYRRFLESFDGFLVGYTPAFAECFASFGKPILIHMGTRYEAPYTSSPAQWSRLNEVLLEIRQSGLLHSTSNNQGDADYLEFFTGISSTVIPSVCDVIQRRGHQSQEFISVVRDRELQNSLTISVPGQALVWRPISTLVKPRVSYRDVLATSRAVVVNPYNISQMLLFELASANIPTFIPSDDLLRTWFSEGRTSLSEISWFQIEQLDVRSLSSADPNNYLSESFLNWWLPRADFNDSKLMPNVIRFDAAEQILDRAFVEDHVEQVHQSWSYSRTEQLRGRQITAMIPFLEMLHHQRG